MGAGIAQVMAASGRHVLLTDSAPGQVDRGLAAISKSLAKVVGKGGPPAADILARIEPVNGIASAELMVEAVVEDMSVKAEIYDYS